MNADERRLIADLFDRMRRMTPVDKDGDAESFIAGEMRRLPDAGYLLVQTVLVQNEALERAEDRIRGLESGTAGESGRSFLRGATAGRGASVPSLRREETLATETPRAAAARANREGWADSTSSFLGSALTTAAGVAGGLLLADGIRSLFDDTPAASAKHTTQDSGATQKAEDHHGGGADGDVQHASDDGGDGDGWDIGEIDI